MSLLYVISICLLVFALLRESIDSRDSYRSCLPERKDTIKKTIEKINVCGFYAQHSVIWRRTYITSIAIIASLFFFNLLFDIETAISIFIIIFTCIYGMLKYYKDTYDKAAGQCIQKLVLQLDKDLKNIY